jgi:hypothetical protein
VGSRHDDGAVDEAEEALVVQAVAEADGEDWAGGARLAEQDGHGGVPAIAGERVMKAAAAGDAEPRDSSAARRAASRPGVNRTNGSLDSRANASRARSRGRLARAAISSGFIRPKGRISAWASKAAASSGGRISLTGRPSQRRVPSAHARRPPFSTITGPNRPNSDCHGKTSAAVLLAVNTT